MADEQVVIPVRIVEEGPKPSEYFQSLDEEGQKAFLSLQREAENFNKSVVKTEQASRNFGTAIRNLGPAAAQFGTGLARVGTQALKYFTILTGGIALINRYNASQNQSNVESKAAVKAAQNDSRAFGQRAQAITRNAEALREFVIQQQQANEDAGRASERQIEDVEERFVRGEISKQEAVQQTEKIQRDAARESSRRAVDQAIATDRLIQSQQREAESQQRLALQRSAEEEERVRITARLQAQQKAEAAYAANVQAFGSETAAGIDQFARAWDRLMTLLNQGPSIVADILKAVAGFINTNGQEIVDTFNKIGDAFGKALFGEGAGDPTKMGESIMKIFRDISSFILNTLIPAFKTFVGVLDTVAAGFNAAFGTKTSGAMILIGVILLQLTGGFRLLIAVVSVLSAGIKVLSAALAALGFTPLGRAIIIVITLVGLLAAAFAAINWQAIVQAAVTAWNGFIEFFRNLPGQITQFFVDLWNNVTQGASDAVQFIIDTWNSLVQFFSDLFASIGQTIVNAWNSVIQFFSEAWETLKTMAQNAMTAIGEYILNAIPGLRQLIEWIGKLTDAFKSAGAAANDNLSPSGGFQVAAAAGGPIYGPGTSTSDSILARLSNGEYVIRAAAVRKYGLRMMNAINGMRFNGFADGGLVRSMFDSVSLPGFASGGPVVASAGATGGARNSQRPVIFQFPDGNEFRMSAEIDTADRLGRYAHKRRMTSSGRKPSSFGAGR